MAAAVCLAHGLLPASPQVRANTEQARSGNAAVRGENANRDGSQRRGRAGTTPAAADASAEEEDGLLRILTFGSARIQVPASAGARRTSAARRGVQGEEGVDESHRQVERGGAQPVVGVHVEQPVGEDVDHLPVQLGLVGHVVDKRM